MRRDQVPEEIIAGKRLPPNQLKRVVPVVKQVRTPQLECSIKNEALNRSS